MAVVKASFTRSRGAAKAYVRYIAHRPGQDGERARRELFGPDGQLTKRQAYRLIDGGGRRTVFYRIVVSPDPGKEDRLKDLDLREITEQTMMQLQDRLKGAPIQFLAAIHADHGTKLIRHVHVLALVPGKLGREDLAALRTAATAAALAQRQDRDQQVDHARRPQPARPHPSHRRLAGLSGRGERGPGGRQANRPAKPLRMAPTCPNCGPGSQMQPRGRFFECPTCGLAVRRSFGLGLGIEAEGGLALSREEVGTP